ncbi:MAG: hypothetical protein R2755_17130 [Acidimicrobiales bacterium]
MDPAVFGLFPDRWRSPEVQLRVACTAPAGWRAGTEGLPLALAELAPKGRVTTGRAGRRPGPDDEAARFARLPRSGPRRRGHVPPPRPFGGVRVVMLWHADVVVLPAVVPGGWPQVAEAALRFHRRHRPYRLVW